MFVWHPISHISPSFAVEEPREQCPHIPERSNDGKGREERVKDHDAKLDPRKTIHGDQVQLT